MGAVGDTTSAHALDDERDEDAEQEEEDAAPAALSAFAASQTPWWFVSLALHGLVLVFAALVYETLQEDSLQGVITVTHLEKPPEAKPEPPPKEALPSELEHKAEATDPESTVASEIEVPKDLNVELSDHFETANNMDGNQALGNPDAHTFQPSDASESDPGGGGTDGELTSDVIGVDGAGSAGSGGGSGGGFGTGNGNDRGSGSGSFGQRGAGGRKQLVMRHGGNKDTENAVEKGLAYLARTQNENGSWNDHRPGEAANGAYDIAVTGLATMAFLGAGHTPKLGKYRETVAKAVDFLIKQQNPDGYIGGCGYPHAIGGMALAEAAGMTKDPKITEAAQKAVDWSIEKHQCRGEGQYDRSGWGYAVRERPTTSVTAWFTMQLKSAKTAGLKVDPAGFEGALRFLDKVTKTEDKGVDAYGAKILNVTSFYMPGEQFYSGSGLRSIDCHKRRMNATNLLIRQFVGGIKKEDPLFQGLVRSTVEGGMPDWTNKDAYHWYYGTMVMFQTGGDAWQKWNEAMKKTLVPNQEHTNPPNQGDDGSWSASTDENYRHGSRVYMTANSVLCLEVYYRYLRMFKE